MGYDTRLMVISANKIRKGNPVGYCGVEATLEMGCVAYGKVGALIQALRETKTKAMQEAIKEYTEEREMVWTPEGEYQEDLKTDAQRKTATKKLSKLRKGLEAKLPFVFAGEEEAYEDWYGDQLLVTDVDTALNAIRFDQATSIAKGENGAQGYRRYALAISLLESFKSDDSFKKIYVVLFGH